MRHSLFASLVLPVVTVALAACSSDAGPGDPGGQAAFPKIDAPAISPRLASPGSSFTGPAARDFASCANENPAVLGEVLPPIAATFVIALYDNTGAPYGMTDGHSVPFPTPWISATVGDGSTVPGRTEKIGIGCSPIAGTHCIYEPDVYAYEHALKQNLSGDVSHQFLVYNLVSTGDTPVYNGGKDPTYIGHYTIPSTAQQWFYNGSTLNTSAEYVAMSNTVAAYKNAGGPASNDSPVSPTFLHCVKVLAYNSSTQMLEATGYHAAIAQSHDPINWPD